MILVQSCFAEETAEVAALAQRRVKVVLEVGDVVLRRGARGEGHDQDAAARRV
jgi:hypothetical protein